MKGRLLTIEEVKKMDGKKVWVEDKYEFYTSDVNVVDIKNNKLIPVNSNESLWTLSNENFSGDVKRIRVYEYIEEPRTYETWEVVKMLTENPKLKFETQEIFQCYVDDDHIVIMDDIGETDNDFILYDKWKLIEEPKKVTFIEAAQAHKDGEKIFCKKDGKTIGFFKHFEGRSYEEDLIFNWEWYIGEPS